ncbi:hypothetical protein CRG98_003389 [Punica granatum]|uniref:Uncharacterized protein n=1 Tax=Punica granatum TaxID=22663 RepID=A0A2I0L6E6_PUNGR|nr:hypothetical protein CRG98_003389 [Punica granatum]
MAREWIVKGAQASSTHEEPERGLTMSAVTVWLIPRLCLGRLPESVYIVAQIELFCSHLLKSMASIAVRLATLNLATGSLVANLIVSYRWMIFARGKGGWPGF